MQVKVERMKVVTVNENKIDKKLTIFIALPRKIENSALAKLAFH
jgi:hypothetical protein